MLREAARLMLANTTIGIVGIGLLGGSLARDLAARGARVLGYDTDQEALEAALAAGVVHQALSPDLEELSDVAVLVLAVPVTAAPAVLGRARPHIRNGTVITDVGSTKRSILAAAAALGLERQFVGAHPLAGDHRAGWTASRTGLFVGARVFLCPGRGAEGEALQTADRLWRALGAETVITTADAHDQLLAGTSHLPQCVAFLMARCLARAAVERSSLGPGGRDTLRLAASPPPLWTGIALDNAGPLINALSELRNGIAELEDALRQNDAARVHEIFDTGRHWFTDS